MLFFYFYKSSHNLCNYFINFCHKTQMMILPYIVLFTHHRCFMVKSLAMKVLSEDRNVSVTKSHYFSAPESGHRPTWWITTIPLSWTFFWGIVYSKHGCVPDDVLKLKGEVDTHPDPQPRSNHQLIAICKWKFSFLQVYLTGEINYSGV